MTHRRALGIRGRSAAPPPVSFCRALRERLPGDLHSGRVTGRKPRRRTAARPDRFLAHVDPGRLSKGCDRGEPRVPDWSARHPSRGGPSSRSSITSMQRAPLPPPREELPCGSVAGRGTPDFTLLVQRWKVIDKKRLTPKYRDLMRDSYDNCLGHLDDCVQSAARRAATERRARANRRDRHGRPRRGTGGAPSVRARGEPYRPEIRVPLVIVIPSHGPSPGGGGGDRQPPRSAGDDR